MTETAYLRFSALQRVEIEEALDDAERSEAVTPEISLDDLAELFGVVDA